MPTSVVSPGPARLLRYLQQCICRRHRLSGPAQPPLFQPISSSGQNLRRDGLVVEDKDRALISGQSFWWQRGSLARRTSPLPSRRASRSGKYPSARFMATDPPQASVPQQRKISARINHRGSKADQLLTPHTRTVKNCSQAWKIFSGLYPPSVRRRPALQPRDELLLRKPPSCKQRHNLQGAKQLLWNVDDRNSPPVASVTLSSAAP